MLALYIRRVAQPLAAAFFMSFLVGFLAISSLVLPTIMVLFTIVHYPLVLLFSRLFRNIRQPFRNIFTLILSISIAFLSTYFLFTPAFLLFNALPLTISLPFLTLTSFFVEFETHIRLLQYYKLGPDFSLIKLIFSPRVQLRAVQVRMLNDILQRVRQGETLDTLERRVLGIAYRRGMIRIPSVARENNTRRPPSPTRMQEQSNQEAQNQADQQEPELLRLSEEKTIALRDRQTTAIRALPQAAVINDMQIFQEYLALGQSNTEVLQNTKTKVAELETIYSSTLTGPQQTRYKAYRDLIKCTAPPYAECCVSLNNVMESNLNTFIIMEKRRGNEPDACIPGKTMVFSYADGFIPLFSLSGTGRAADPTTREKYFGIHGAKTGFVFHTYEIVEGHVLSLQLTECVEKFVNTLSLAPGEADVIDEEDESIPDYRNAAPSPNSSITSNNMFSPSADEDEWANVLAEAGLNLSEAELAFNRNQR